MKTFVVPEEIIEIHASDDDFDKFLADGFTPIIEVELDK